MRGVSNAWLGEGLILGLTGLRGGGCSWLPWRQQIKTDWDFSCRVDFVEAKGDYFEMIYGNPKEVRNVECMSQNNDFCSVSNNAKLVRPLPVCYWAWLKVVHSNEDLSRQLAAWGRLQNNVQRDLCPGTLQEYGPNTMWAVSRVILRGRQVQPGKNGLFLQHTTS